MLSYISEEKSYTLTQLPFAKRINAVIYSNAFPFIVAFVTILSHLLAIELYAYVLVGVLMIYVSFFGKDFSPLLALVVNCFIMPSRYNNPGKHAGSIFFLQNGAWVILVAAVLMIVAAVIRLARDREIGFYRMCRTRGCLLWGLVGLGVTYLLSGIGSAGYFSIAAKNLVFSLLQFIAVFFCYFLLSFSVKWKELDKRYFMYVGLLVGLVVGIELVNLFFTADLFDSTGLVRMFIYVGWGINNNMGCMIAMSVPFAFYFIYKGDKPLLYLPLALLLCGFAVLSTSRAAILGAGVAFLLCSVFVLWKSRSRAARLTTGISLLLLTCFGVVVLTSNSELIRVTFENGLQSNSRLSLYELGLQKFAQNPVFGNSFYLLNDYSVEHNIWDKVPEFKAGFPERWHNTVVQLLASCGLVGFLAYVCHRYQTFGLFLKKPTAEKSFIAGGLLVIMGLSFIDCHFFNIGPTLFYSCALAAAEFCTEE